MISIDNLRLGYGRGPDVVTLEHQTIRTGEVISLVGPNGGGKTTLLRCVSGLLKPRRGTILLDGHPLYGSGAWSREERARHLAVVLTDRITPAYLRVRELVGLGRIPYGLGRATIGHREIVDHALAATGVSHLKERSAGQLSDGERQRVMIARALAQEPRILLLDEPAAHLDPPHQTALFVLLHELITREIIEAVVIATHHLHLALHFSHRIVLVAGDLQQSGPPAELLASGALARAFSATDAVHLDPVRGWFVPQESPVDADNVHNS